MRKFIALGVLFIGFFKPAMSQKIDNLVSFRDIKSISYARLHYDNDYFAATDRNYTQGYSLELVAPFLETNPVNTLFYKPKDAVKRYGLAIEHIGFTPARYELPEIQVGDRPFAAAIMLKSFMITTNEQQNSRLIAAFSLGIIGPGAFGEEMQVGIHKATGNKIPLGWQHQIKNDVVINYELGYEKQLFRFRELFSLQAQATARAGTLFTNGSIGLNATLGIINSTFTNSSKRNDFKLYGYAQPVFHFIGYDATLQGGVFNRQSPYTIASSNVERFTAHYTYGIVLKTKSLYIEYTRSFTSKEFATGEAYKWGGIRIGSVI